MEAGLDSLMVTSVPAKDGSMDRAELERELERMHAACWGWALACGGRDRDVAEEALQSAYLRILSGQARFGGRSSLRTWVFGVIRRTAMEEVRRRRVRNAHEPGDEMAVELIPDPAPGADVAAERNGERTTLIAALGTLPARQCEVLQLVFYHGLTIEEAANVMSISLGSARTHYDRGKKALALALSPALAPLGTSRRDIMP
jgi:RNA polymerase sigma-70 factor (ECF subfamily)